MSQGKGGVAQGPKANCDSRDGASHQNVLMCGGQGVRRSQGYSAASMVKIVIKQGVLEVGAKQWRQEIGN